MIRRNWKTQGPDEGESLPRWVTFLLWVVSSARWKLEVKKNSRPTKRLLRVKTSATMDHCQLSLETANSPPASTAPGPGPVNLREERPSLLYATLERSVTFHTNPGKLYVYFISHTVPGSSQSNQKAQRRSQTLLDQLKCCFNDIKYFTMGLQSSKGFWTKINLKNIF